MVVVLLAVMAALALLTWSAPSQARSDKQEPKQEATMKKFRVRVVGTSPNGKAAFVEYKVVEASFVFEAKDLAMGQVMQFNPFARNDGYQLTVTEVKEVR